MKARPRLKASLNLAPDRGEVIGRMNAMAKDEKATARLILRHQTYEVKAGMSLRSALEKAGINPETVIATRNGELITDDEILQDGDVIKLVAVISGGALRG
jgi:sulfur carrier protein